MGRTVRRDRLEKLRSAVAAEVDREVAVLQRERKLLKLALGDARDNAAAASDETDEYLVLASIKEIMEVD